MLTTEPCGGNTETQVSNDSLPSTLWIHRKAGIFPGLESTAFLLAVPSSNRVHLVFARLEFCLQWPKLQITCWKSWANDGAGPRSTAEVRPNRKEEVRRIINPTANWRDWAQKAASHTWLFPRGSVERKRKSKVYKMMPTKMLLPRRG